MEQLDSNLLTLSMLRNLGFCMIWKHKDSFLFLEWLSQVTHICKWFLTKAYFEILSSLLIILLLRSLCGALGSDENCEAHLPCICCKVKFCTSSERSVILLDQNSASVWNFWWNYTPLFDMISYSSFCFETWLSYSSMSLHVLIIFFEYFWDLHCVPIFFYTLGPSCVPFFFNLFA